MDRSEDSINGSMTYLKQRNDDGSLIFIDDESIFEDLRPILTALQPPNESVFIYTIDNDFPIEATYDRGIVLTDDLTKEIRIYKDEVLIETLTIEDVVGINGNTLQIKNTQVYEKGNYRIEIDDDFVKEDVFRLFGAKGLTNWNFSVRGRIHNNVFKRVYN